MSIVRKRNAAAKSYIPTNARDNQYILAEFALTDQLLASLPAQIAKDGSNNYYGCYQALAKLLFTLSDEAGIKNSVLVANNKLVRVRYSQEMHQWQTKHHILLRSKSTRITKCVF